MKSKVAQKKLQQIISSIRRRQLKNHTQELFAKELGISAKLIQKYESGKNPISVSYILKLKKYCESDKEYRTLLSCAMCTSDRITIPINDFFPDKKTQLLYIMYLSYLLADFNDKFANDALSLWKKDVIFPYVTLYTEESELEIFPFVDEACF